MSYEGYVQVLCRSGHLHQIDAYNFSSIRISPKVGVQGAEWRCGFGCADLIGWYNHVDDTNSEEAGKVHLTKVTEEQGETCNLGHYHVTVEATWKPEPGTGFSVNGGLK